MAQEIIGFKIEINGQEKVVKSLGEMKQLLKEANFELLAAQQNFGEYSTEAINAAKKVATLKDTLQEAGETAQLFDPGKKFQAFAGALSAAAGGITAFQGALGLIGVESENVEKSLLKVQSALALSQGLSTIADSVKDFERLKAVIQSTTAFQKIYNLATIAASAIQRAFGVAVTTTGVAFKALRAAIITTGIGALVVGIGLLVNKIMDWVDSASEAEKAQEKLAAATKRLNSDIDNQIAILTALGDKEDEIYKLRLKRNENELNVLRNKLKTQGKLTDEELEQFRKLKTDKEVLDIQETKRIKKKDEDELKDRKTANDKAREQRDANQKEILAAEKALEDLRIENIQNEFLRNQEKINLDFKRRKEEIENLKISEQLKTALLIEEQTKRDIALEENAKFLRKISNEAKKEAKLNDVKEKGETLDIETRFQKDLAQIEKLKVEVTKNANAQQLADDIATKQARADVVNGYADIANGVANLLRQVAGENKTLQIAAIVAEQAGSVARIIANNAVANAKAVAVSPLTAGQPFVSINSISAGISIASTIAAAAKGIQQIKGSGQSVGGASTIPRGSAGAPISPEPPLVNTRTQLDTGTIQQLGNATNRAYVIESDVTNNQERIRRINRAARLA